MNSSSRRIFLYNLCLFKHFLLTLPFFFRILPSFFFFRIQVFHNSSSPILLPSTPFFYSSSFHPYPHLFVSFASLIFLLFPSFSSSSSIFLQLLFPHFPELLF
uniref:Uncharacterized protein n=1 Tax=Meloidogyne enterolobii TaxID=390850 RepID=A0A6V7WJ99_MELEN|nr:unnamed protein product [Meloidogyne enterolobii]